ncbi:MAG: sulfur carrier protein ThiS [Gammaproteobacteria bacterium]
MQVTVNGSVYEIPNETTAREMIHRLELTGRRIAMEVNGEIVPRSAYGDHLFRDGDSIEVIHAVGGG